MGTVVPTKNERTAPINSLSFIYRQDGHELSYVISLIIQISPSSVNGKFFVADVFSLAISRLRVIIIL